MSRGGDHDAAEAMLPNGASSRRVGLPVSIGSHQKNDTGCTLCRQGEKVAGRAYAFALPRQDVARYAASIGLTG